MKDNIDHPPPTRQFEDTMEGTKGFEGGERIQTLKERKFNSVTLRASNMPTIEARRPYPWETNETAFDAEAEAVINTRQRQRLQAENPYSLRSLNEPLQSPQTDLQQFTFTLPPPIRPVQRQRATRSQGVSSPTPSQAEESDLPLRAHPRYSRIGDPDTGLRKRQHPDNDEEELRPRKRNYRLAEQRRDAEEQEETQDQKVCEFSSPCRMNPSPDGMHWRKVVSHIFGRNKASTKLFPDSVWVHYCRKHYQRARYRADQWPFTQCELLLESLERMEQWGGVESFELTLRRREAIRIDHDQTSPTPAPRYLQTGRKHPTAITSPVPEWLRQYTGANKSFKEIRRIVLRVREWMVARRRDEKAAQGQRDTPVGTPRRETASRATTSRGWNPVNVNRAAANGSDGPRQQYTSHVRFPDVEILPKFKPWVEEMENRRKLRLRNARKREQGDVTRVAECRSQDGAQESGQTEMYQHEEEEYRPAPEEVEAAQYYEERDETPDARSERQRRGVTRVTPRGSVKKPNSSV